MDRVIGPPLSSTPAVTGAPAREPLAVPDDILKESKQRLSVIALIGGLLWLTATILYHLARRAIVPDDPTWYRLGVPDAIALVNVVVSATFCGWTRSARDPAHVLRVGLYYMLWTSFSISVIWHWDPAMHPGQITPMITWVGVVVLLFAAILPIEPRRIVLVGFLCACMNPIIPTSCWSASPAVFRSWSRSSGTRSRKRVTWGVITWAS